MLMWLPKCLKKNNNPAIAFQAYEALRFPRTKAIVEQSLKSGKMGQLKNPLAVGFRNTLMKVMGAEISKSFERFHAYRA